MGTCPLRKAANFRWSLSTKMTSWPRSAKQAPATNPTYPEPTTAIRIADSSAHLQPAKLTIFRAERFYNVRKPVWVPWSKNFAQGTKLGSGFNQNQGFEIALPLRILLKVRANGRIMASRSIAAPRLRMTNPSRLPDPLHEALSEEESSSRAQASLLASNDEILQV